MSKSPGNSSFREKDKTQDEGSKEIRGSLWNNVALAIGVLVVGASIPIILGLLDKTQKTTIIDPKKLPATAQVIDQKSFNVLQHVPPPKEANATTVRHSRQSSNSCSFVYSDFCGQESHMNPSPSSHFMSMMQNS
jgi:hypothetical protein